MKRIILLLMCVISMVAYAQKTPARKVTPSTNHISFMGISLGENLNTFKNKLKAINYKVREHNDEYEPWTDIEGSLGGVYNINFDFGYDYENHKILYFEGGKKYQNKQAAEIDFYKLKLFVDKKYKQNESCLYDFKVIKGYYKYLYIKNVENAFGKLVGHIYISYFKENDENNSNIFYGLNIKYVDLSNSLSFDRDYRLGYKIPIDCKTKNLESTDNKLSYTTYNISKFTYPLFDSCVLNVEDDYLKITATSQGQIYNIYAFEDDRSSILCTLFGDTKEDSRGGIFQTYLKRAFLKLNDFRLCTTTTMDDAISEYCFPKQNNNQPHQMSKGELWFCLWEGSERIAKYKADGSYQRRMQMFINTWNSIAGSGGGSTNWDGLNDAQKAAIHEHDNAR